MTEQNNNQQAAKNKTQDTDKGKGSGKGMWGGRVGEGPSAIMQAIMILATRDVAARPKSRKKRASKRGTRQRK